MPSKLYGMVGEEYNIYFQNILNDDVRDYDFAVTSYVGEQLEDRLRIVPPEHGIYEITIKAYRDGVEKASATSFLMVADREAGRDETRSVLVIGDSTTANGTCMEKLVQNFEGDVMDISLLGTKGSKGIYHEGISGWKLEDYVKGSERDNEINLFWNTESNHFDFRFYMDEQGYESVDYVFINLGINDLFGVSEEELKDKKIEEMLGWLTEMTDSIHEFDPSIKIGIAVTTPPGDDQNAFGKAYGTAHNLWQYRRKYFLWCNALIKEFGQQEEAGIYLIPINTNLDTKHNMGIETETVNARNEMTVDRISANGNVHPDESGYWQIADVYWFFIKTCETFE